MKDINLLPEELASISREEKKQISIKKIIISVLIISFISIVTYAPFYIDGLLDKEIQELDKILLKNEYKEVEKINEKIKMLESEIEKSEFFLKEIVKNSIYPDDILDIIKNSLPEGVLIYEFRQNGKSIKIKGIARDTQQASNFLDNVSRLEYIKMGEDIKSIKLEKLGAGIPFFFDYSFELLR
jgi:Tfp pilus assembly protein PilN